MSSPDPAQSDVDFSESYDNTAGDQKRKSVIDSRRAEQNRAAQRAFRQRKERYVKELETKVRDMQGLQERADKLEEENRRLRQRIWELEHRPSSSPWKPALLGSTLDPQPTKLARRVRPRFNPHSPPTTHLPDPNSPCMDDSPDIDSSTEKGRVLDDLIVMLRSRQRPPIPTHLNDDTHPIEMRNIETSIR